MIVDRFTGEIKINLVSNTLISGRFFLREPKGSLLFDDGSHTLHVYGHLGRFESCELNEVDEQQQILLDESIQAINAEISVSDIDSPELVSPLLPAKLAEHGELLPFEEELFNVLRNGHLQEIDRNPRLDLIQTDELLPVGRAKRLANKALSHLASHSENWQARTIVGVYPKRLLARENRDNFVIYENIVYARLLDNLQKHLAGRIAQLERLKTLYEQGQNFSIDSETNWRLSKSLCELWGETFNEETFAHVVDINKDVLEQLKGGFKKISQLINGKLYARIPKKKSIGSSIQGSNILVHDQHYRYLVPLWNGYVGLKSCAEKQTPENILDQAQDHVEQFGNYVFLIIVRALFQLRYTVDISSKNASFANDGGRLVSAVRKDNEVLLQCAGCDEIRFVPIYSDLTPLLGSLPVSCREGEIRVVCFPPHPKQSEQEPLGCPENGHVYFMGLSPLHFYSLERVVSLLQLWLAVPIFQDYCKPVEKVSSRVFAVMKQFSDYLYITGNSIQLHRPLPENWKELFDLKIEETDSNPLLRQADNYKITYDIVAERQKSLILLSLCPSCGKKITEYDWRSLDHECVKCTCDSCNIDWGISREADGVKSIYVSDTDTFMSDIVDFREYGHHCVAVRMT